MTNVKLFYLLLIVFLTTNPSFSQTKHFTWSGLPNCSYEGDYDSSKYSDLEIEDTYKFAYEMSAPDFRSPFSNFEAVTKDYIDSLRKGRNKRIAYLKNLHLIKSSFWESQRVKKIIVANQVFDSFVSMHEAYKNPNVLRKANQSTECQVFIESLKKEDSLLLKYWQELSDSLCQQSYPHERCYKESYLNQRDSPKKYFLAKATIIYYVWWHCSSEEYIKALGDNLDIRQNFNSMFENFKVRCGE